jgi:flagellar basal-body rod protein FlgB
MTQFFNDTTTKAIEFALLGLNERQQTTAHNIANVNTPGFHSSRIRFEDQLAEALRSGRPVEDLEARRVAANTPINARGNDVALEEESQDLIESGVQYEALVNALNYKLNVLRSAVRGV